MELDCQDTHIAVIKLPLSRLPVKSRAAADMHGRRSQAKQAGLADQLCVQILCWHVHNLTKGDRFISRTRTGGWAASRWASCRARRASGCCYRRVPAVAIAVTEDSPAGGRHADGQDAHGVRRVEQRLARSGRWRATPRVPAPEQLSRRLPKVADLVLHRL